MKHKWLLVMVICITVSIAFSDGKEAAWSTDYPAAIQKAKQDKKLLLMDFTGSDFCIACKKLKKEVFSKTEFINYAKTNLVLLEVDFPENKPQPPELKKANEALAKQYNIEGYPTIIVLDPEGKNVGTLTYEPGGPGPFIEKLKALKKN